MGNCCNNCSEVSCDKVLFCINKQLTRYVNDQSTELVNFCEAVSKCANAQLLNISLNQPTTLSYFSAAVESYLKTLTGYSSSSTLVFTTVSNVLQWAVGGGGGSGTLTSVVSGDGMDFSTITTVGTVTMGLPSSVTLSSTNSLTSTSHTHAFTPGGSSSQVILGDGTLGTLPTGSVTSFIFTDGNGFDGTVTNSTTTPTLSLITTVANTRFMYSNSGAIAGTELASFADLSWVPTGGAGGVNGILQLNSYGFSNEVGLMYKGDDYGFVRNEVQNTYLGSGGGGLIGAASGYQAKNVIDGTIGQFYLGFAGNVFMNNGLMIRSTGTGGVRLSADTGLITFSVSANGANEYARFTGTSTRRFGILTTVPDTTLHVVGDLKFVTGNQGAGKVLTSDANGVADWASTSSAFTVPINSLLAATGTNSIDNTTRTQTWNWTGLVSGGLNLSSTSTAMTNSSYLLASSLSGVNASSGITSYATYFQNTHTGTSSTNVAIFASASGGTTNISLDATGIIRANTGLNFNGASSPLQANSSAGTAGQVLTSAGAGVTPTWTTPAGTFALTNGSGTTVGGDTTSVDLGGTTTGDVNILTGANLFNIDGTGDMNFGDFTGLGNATDIAVRDAAQLIQLNAAGSVRLNTPVMFPINDNTTALGTTSKNFSDLFLGDGAVINFNANNVVLTHSSGILTMGTGEMRITTAGTNTASVVTVGGTQTLTGKSIAIGSITGLGTGVATALAVNTGSAGAFVVNGGALGTPSSGTLTSATGYLWNNLANPTGDQALTFGVGFSSIWTNQNTTEDLLTINSSTITTSSLLSLNSTSTALASGNNLAEFIMSGANGSSAITATGVRVSVTNTGTTSVNVGADITATGGASNVALILTAAAGSSSSRSMQVTGRAGFAGVTAPQFDIDAGNGSIAGGSLYAGPAGGGTNGNFMTANTSLMTSNVNSIFQVLSSTAINGRIFIGGTGATAISTGAPYGTIIVGAATVPEFSSGNHPLISSMILIPPTITVGAATVTDGATLYIDGPTAGTVSGTNTSIQVRTGNVEFRNGNLSLGTAGNKLTITEGTDGRVGQTTLVAGTKAITINGVTTSSRAFVQLVTPNSASLTVQYQAVCTANTLTIQANIGATTINVADVSVLNYFILN